MFAFLKPEKPYEQDAILVYASCVQAARQTVFYTELGVADVFETRFDVLALHVYLVMARVIAEDGFDAAAFNQALFDVMFADMDQTLREMGMGDMGVPKRMKKMMTGFNGRVHAYGQDMAEALARNIYADEGADVRGLLAYVEGQQARLNDLEIEQILAGGIFDGEK